MSFVKYIFEMWMEKSFVIRDRNDIEKKSALYSQVAVGTPYMSLEDIWNVGFFIVCGNF